MNRRCLAMFLAGVLTGPPALAHPHIFVDTTLHFEVTDGMVTAVDVTWSYDDFFTLLIFEDMGLDADLDGVLSEAELAKLKGFDLIEWPEGFEGDLYLYQSGTKVALDLPKPTAIRVEDARIIASHRRTIEPTPADGLEILQYDPTFYVAYELTGGVTMTGDCRAEITKPDLDAASALVAEKLEEVPEDQFEVLEVGIHYADRARVTCGTGS